MQLPNRRVLAISLGVLVIIAGMVLIAQHNSKTPNAGSAGEHVDQFSHEVVSNPPGKTPDTYGSEPNTPLYLGFDKLMNNGLSLDQMKNVEQAFYKYSLSLSKPLKQVSVGADDIKTSHDPSDPNSPFVILFNVQFDGKDIYPAKVQYIGLDDVRLFIMSADNSKVIYDSQVLGTESG